MKEQDCTHEPKAGRETSHEWIEFRCTECWKLYDDEKRTTALKELAAKMETHELNQYGRYTIYGKYGKPSGRPDGLWILGSVSLEEMPRLLEYASDD